MLLVDAANVIGSRPTGWWRDRLGAAGRFTERVRASVSAGRLDSPVTIVLEGRFREGAPEGLVDGVAVVHASGEGDDTIVVLAGVVDRDHVRVVERGGEARLPQEAPAEPRILRHLRRDELQGDRSSQRRVERAVDDAHPAAPEDRLDAQATERRAREQRRAHPLRPVSDQPKRVLGSVGAYRLEGPSVHLFEKIEGDYFSILGLPLLPLTAALRAHAPQTLERFT